VTLIETSVGQDQYKSKRNVLNEIENIHLSFWNTSPSQQMSNWGTLYDEKHGSCKAKFKTCIIYASTDAELQLATANMSH